MKLKLNAGDKIKIPDNCNAVIKDGVVVIEENKPNFKKGDFIASIGGWVYIFDESNNRIYTWFAKTKPSLSVFINNTNNYYTAEYENTFRLATDSEKQLLLDKLHENGKDWNSEKCEIVDLKYVPRVGDCLKLESSFADSVFIECSGIDDGKFPCGYETIITCGEVYTNNYTGLGWGVTWEVTKITREELQAEFNKLGYEYDFETHTAKKIEWKPKIGETYYYIDVFGVFEDSWEGVDFDVSGLQNGAVFRTRELAEAALELLKNAKHY